MNIDGFNSKLSLRIENSTETDLRNRKQSEACIVYIELTKRY